MTKRRNVQYFDCVINGVKYEFTAYTTDTRNGFCHTVVSEDYGVTDTKVSYMNRTWESFCYETALCKMIDKFPKHWRERMRNQLIEKKEAEERDRCDKEMKEFEGLYNSLSNESKERMAKSGIVMESEEDVKLVKGLMMLEKMMGA